MALCIASALRQPFGPWRTADTDVKTVLGHDEFQRLVDEAGAELYRARAMRLVDDEFQWHIMDEVKCNVKTEESGLWTTSSSSSGDEACGRRLGRSAKRKK